MAVGAVYALELRPRIIEHSTQNLLVTPGFNCCREEESKTRSSVVAVIADRTACSSSLRSAKTRSAKTTIGLQRDFYRYSL